MQNDHIISKADHGGFMPFGVSLEDILFQSVQGHIGPAGANERNRAVSYEKPILVRFKTEIISDLLKTENFWGYLPFYSDIDG